jgi:peptidylamidoglycolate lyase
MKKKLNYKQIAIFYFLLVLLLVGCQNPVKKKVDKQSKNRGSYILVEEWPKLSKNHVLGLPSGLGIDSNNNILVLHRANRIWGDTLPEDKIQENTLITLDKQTGKVLKSWGANLFIMPHGLEIDKENNIWVTDVGLHQIFKFNSEGKLLLTLGEAKVYGDDSSHFNLPTDIAVSDDGSFYVSDGYYNRRIVKFSKDGTYLFEWGKHGSKRGEFMVPHGIDLDHFGNVYVADRENNRIQKFDTKGNFIAEWNNNETGMLLSVAIDKKNDYLFAIDLMIENNTNLKGSDIFRFDLNMNLQMQFGRKGFNNNSTSMYHDIIIDDEGNIYVADSSDKTIKKFQQKKSE